MKNWKELLGVEFSPVSHEEKLLSAVGGFFGILGVAAISHWFLPSLGANLIIASMGATAVLLFAVPHGALSQPWAVLVGHTVSALIGVTCALFVSHEFVAAAAAVGLAIGAMYYLRCIHPPGGATALAAVIGGESTHALGYQFVLTPILLNAFIILGIAVLFNYFFPWRRYPEPLSIRRKKTVSMAPSAEPHREIAHADLVYALSQIDSFIDVTEHDLLQIYDIATTKSQLSHLSPEDIQLGRCYSNGKFGEEWSVRQVFDESRNEDESKDLLVYKVVAGMGRRSSGVLSRAEFARWAKHEVQRDEDNWKRVTRELN